MTPVTRGTPTMLKAAIVCAVLAVIVFGLATTARCQERTSMRLALTAMGVGQGLDTVSTIQALNRGAVETNPLLGARPSAAKLIAAKLPMIGVGWLLTKVHPRHPKIAKGTAYVIGAVGAGLAIHNARKGRS